MQIETFEKGLVPCGAEFKVYCFDGSHSVCLSRHMTPARAYRAARKHEKKHDGCFVTIRIVVFFKIELPLLAVDDFVPYAEMLEKVLVERRE